MDTQKKFSWLERIEEIIHVLEGSSIGELELTEAGTDIIIRRSPNMVLVSNTPQGGTSAADGLTPAVGLSTSITIIAPLTGVYYSAASPSSPPFVSIGDIVQVGQLIALVEAMKVFNEIQAEVSGRVVALVAKNGEVVKKGDVLLRVEPS
jgi:biotin carboxyl carrier protein